MAAITAVMGQFCGSHVVHHRCTCTRT